MQPSALAIPRTVVLTGHFPPEPGGVQTFTYELVRRLPADRLVVVAPHHPDARAFDRTLDFPVYRRRGYLLTAGLRRVVQRHGATAGWITAAAPFGMYASALRHAGARHIVASSHGQELGWLRVPPTRWALRGMVRSVDVFTCLSPSTWRTLAPVFRPEDVVAQLHGGVDTERFHPGAGGDIVRSLLGLGDRPLVVSLSRLVRRKGHDLLLEAWPEVRRRVPDAVLLIVGEGPMLDPLRRRAAAPDLAGSVLVTGPIATPEVPGYLDAGDVFVLPCRDNRAGLQVEGLGLAVLEASATGLPVVVGRSGGSGEALVDRSTGLLVDSSRPGAIAGALIDLLSHPDRARWMGEEGRRWIGREWTWDAAALRLAALLRGSARVPGPDGMASPAGRASPSGTGSTAGTGSGIGSSGGSPGSTGRGHGQPVESSPDGTSAGPP